MNKKMMSAAFFIVVCTIAIILTVCYAKNTKKEVETMNANSAPLVSCTYIGSTTFDEEVLNNEFGRMVYAHWIVIDNGNEYAEIRRKYKIPSDGKDWISNMDFDNHSYLFSFTRKILNVETAFLNNDTKDGKLVLAAELNKSGEARRVYCYELDKRDYVPSVVSSPVYYDFGDGKVYAADRVMDFMKDTVND